jgi:predicted amidohydrolase YtcJ
LGTLNRFSTHATKIVFCLSVALFGALPANAEEPEQVEQTESVTIYTAQEIITLENAVPGGNAVAVAQDRIVDVGNRETLWPKWAKKGAVLDEQFGDKYIVPGFIEPHIHPTLSALTLTSKIISIEDWNTGRGHYPAAKDREDYLARLNEVAQGMKDPKKPLLSWGFHHYFHGKLTRADLDRISSTRAIIIWHRSAHEFILNSKALELAGITRESMQSVKESVREQIDLSNGHFWERGTFDYLQPRILKFLLPKLTEGLQLTEDYLHRAGVTTAAEPGGVPLFYKQQSAVLGDEDTPFRFFFIADGRTLAAKLGGDALLKATENSMQGVSGKAATLDKQVKLFSDGAIYSQLMQMRDGYLDGHHGEWLMDKQIFHDSFRTYWDAGYQIHIHQNGDKGLDRVLDALRSSMKRNPRKDHRTTIVHFGYSTREQIRELAKLGAIISANPYYTSALADKYSELGLGPERANSVVRLAEVVEQGIPLSLHSDMPMAPAQPLFLMWAAVNRTTFSGRVAGPELRISAEEALRAVTIDAAYSLRLEKEIGTISIGKRADFTVLGDNPLTVAPAAIKDIEVIATVSGGRVFRTEK